MGFYFVAAAAVPTEFRCGSGLHGLNPEQSAVLKPCSGCAIGGRAHTVVLLGSTRSGLAGHECGPWDAEAVESSWRHRKTEKKRH